MSAICGRQGFRLEYATMTWMATEAAVAIRAGLLATSIALVCFGPDGGHARLDQHPRDRELFQPDGSPSPAPQLGVRRARRAC